MIGTNLSVILLGERDSVTGLPQALSDNYIRVLIEGSVPERGKIVSARLDRCEKLVCFGHVVDQ